MKKIIYIFLAVSLMIVNSATAQEILKVSVGGSAGLLPGAVVKVSGDDAVALCTEGDTPIGVIVGYEDEGVDRHYLITPAGMATNVVCAVNITAGDQLVPAGGGQVQRVADDPDGFIVGTALENTTAGSPAKIMVNIVPPTASGGEDNQTITTGAGVTGAEAGTDGNFTIDLDLTANGGLSFTGTGVSRTVGVNFGTGTNQAARGDHAHQTLTRGTGLTGANYNGSSATTFAVDFGTGTNQAARGDHNHSGLYDNYNNWLIAASGTAGTGTVSSGNTVTISAGTGISATRSTRNVTIENTAPWTSSSNDYIQNQTTSNQSAGFRISGNGIFNGGNVGIGTTAPAHKLHISYASTDIYGIYVTMPGWAIYGDATGGGGRGVMGRGGEMGIRGENLFDSAVWGALGYSDGTNYYAGYFNRNAGVANGYGYYLDGTTSNNAGIYTQSASNRLFVRAETTSSVAMFHSTGLTVRPTGTGGYLNFGNSTAGTSGYGIRDNSGVMEFKNSGGSWAGIGTVGGTGAAGKVAFWTGGSTLSSNTNFHWDNTNARLGIGTATVEAKLHVVQDATTQPGIYSEITPTTSTYSAIEASNPNTSGGAGVISSGYFGGVFYGGYEGVYATSEAATGFAGRFHNNDPSGTGLLASGNDVSGTYMTGGSGVAGSSSNIGVFGYGTSASGSIGLYGSTDATDGVAVVGDYSEDIYGVLGTQYNGVLGVSNNFDGAGVLGNGGTATSGVFGRTEFIVVPDLQGGVYGIGDGNGALGVIGRGLGGEDATGIAGWGADLTSLTVVRGVGVIGQADSDIYGYLGGSNAAVFGKNESPDVSVAQFGVIGQSIGAGSTTEHFGVYGYATGGSSNFGVYSDAAVGVGEYTINLSGSSGTWNNVGIGDASYVRIYGAGGATTITGFTGGYNGRILYVFWDATYNMSISHQNTGSTTTNRIITNTGGTVTTSGVGMATFIYSDTLSRWILISWLS